MNRTLLIGLVVLAAAAGLVLYFTKRADAAVRTRTRPSGQPPPLADASQTPQLRPEVAQLFVDPVHQKEGLPPGVQLQKVATLKPGVRGLFQ